MSMPPSRTSIILPAAMDPHRARVLQTTLEYLQHLDIPLSALVLYALQQYRDPAHPILVDLVRHTTSIAASLYYNEATKINLYPWILQTARIHYGDAAHSLSLRENGWHFNAGKTHPNQVRDFHIEDMIAGMYRAAPELWALFQNLFGFDPEELPPVEKEVLLDEDDADEDYWSSEPTSAIEADRARRARFINIKIAMILSVLAQGRDPHCNALQSIVGIFCRACNAPEKLMKVLLRMGVSISLESVRRATLSMSAKSSESIESVGRSLLVSFGFDNLDILIKTLVPTVDDPHARGMLHLTSATMFRLAHGVTLDDLRCSDLLWERSEYNIQSPHRIVFDPTATMERLLSLHPEPMMPEQSSDSAPALSRRGQFRSWVFQRTLVDHGPSFFRKYADQLPDPQPVEQIPITKLEQVPLRAMDINLSTVAGNIKAIYEILRQAGLGDPETAPPVFSPSGNLPEDISQLVILFGGNLGTYERVLSALRRRSVEHTPYERLQFMVFILGLFHLKMAAADTIWRLLVTPEGARKDETGFYKIAAKLRPNTSSHIIANAKFREQHELIEHVGVILRLDAWRTEVERRTRLATLEEWAETKPSLADIKEFADQLVCDYVEGEGINLFDLSLNPPSARDSVHENTIRTQHYLLMYTELSYSMNAGDIGRIEATYQVWIPLFRAAGKHKYGSRTLHFLHSLYFVYPERLT
ncbi:hypothetical protein C8Q77DRAFT_1169779 [Trametes polyzona]|nr:hypothetical protein C8Q77DRAFT_1169779 [Trametes polyzona]